jgi:hypothetical protein
MHITAYFRDFKIINAYFTGFKAEKVLKTIYIMFYINVFSYQKNALSQQSHLTNFLNFYNAILMFDVDVLEFFSTYFGAFSAYLGIIAYFHAYVIVFKCITIRSLIITEFNCCLLSNEATSDFFFISTHT